MSTPAPRPVSGTTTAADPGRRLHPRRPTADRSVSLLHPSRTATLRRLSAGGSVSPSSSNSGKPGLLCKTAQRPDSDSPASLNPPEKKGSSGESSSAEKWFDTSNFDVRGTSTSFANHDPPFFMRNSSSSETPPDHRRAAQPFLEPDFAHSLPVRTDTLQLGNDGSSTEEFRGVIDDLTVENKKLKTRLKQYERLHDSHLKDEKLFEVRIHGLAPDKKRELEETLRRFAAGLGNTGSRTGPEFPVKGYEGLAPLLQKAASSHASMQNPDSAYASMSASGHGSSTGEVRQKGLPHSVHTRQQNVQSYLHDIPVSLLPQCDPGTLSEKAKRKLVVRRLEQIFAGKGATVGGHQQALQQQGVSHMAARADRIDKISLQGARGRQSRQEGTREAQILQNGLKELSGPSPDKPEGKPLPGGGSDPLHRQEPESPAVADQLAHSSIAEQRPTRPLDVDPRRAQVPADNVRYMRHLGFTLPSPGHEGDALSRDEHGWVYLNILINMAQLHTINVTSEFVRKALAHYSAKFEVSNDGRKVRWKGGSSLTRTSSSGGDSSIDRTDEENISGESPRKRLKLSGMASARSRLLEPGEPSMGSARPYGVEKSRISYTPLFFHGDSTGDEDSASDMEDDDSVSSSPFRPVFGGASSAVTSPGMRTAPNRGKRQRKLDDGPIIFYSNARFCTDLSGDRTLHTSHDAPLYARASSLPIGKPQAAVAELPAEKRGPLAGAFELPEPMNLGDNPIPESMELAFPPSPLPDADAEPGYAQQPMGFEVTGIGGVYPADNFAISVDSRYAIVDQSESAAESTLAARKLLPTEVSRFLGDGCPARRSRPAVKQQVVASRRRDLPPSVLPPALSFMPFDGDDDASDDSSDAEEQTSLGHGATSPIPRLAAPQQMTLHYSGVDDSEPGSAYDEDEDGGDEESDSSLDLLAAARMVDPEAIRAREREYDANMAERLAEELPTGGSAATAGGGSGFTSPINAAYEAAYLKAKTEARNRTPALSRAETTDSMAVAVQESSSAGGDVEERSVLT